MNSDRDLLTRREAAEMLRLSEHTLAIWALTDKNLKIVRFNRSVRYHKKDIEDFIREHTFGASPQEQEE
jgi:hypothetical protein